MPAYIKRLRQLAGTELLLLPAVAALARDEAGRVLLVHSTESGLWTLPGGLLEPDERPEDAAVREALEEAGLAIELGSVLGVFGGEDFRHTYANGDRVAVMLAVFGATAPDGAPRGDGDETDAADWFAPAALSGLELSARAAIVLERLL